MVPGQYIRHRHARRALCVLLTLVLLLPLQPGAEARPFMFFAAELSTIAMTEATLPRFAEDGSLLVSHVVLEGTIPGLMSVWEPDTRNYTLLYSSKMLTFEYGRGTAFSPVSGYGAEMLIDTYEGADIYFVSLDLVCDYFGWSCSLYAVDWGVMIRLGAKKPAVSDKYYFSIYEKELSAAYEALINPVVPAGPEPPLPGESPGTRPPETQTPGISASPNVSASPEPSPSPAPAQLYLTFEGDCGEMAAEIGALLYEHSLPAVFFFTDESLEANAGLLRALSARHTIGLLNDGTQGVDEQALREANERLYALSFRQTLLFRVSADNPDTEELITLEEKGYQCVRYNLRLSADLDAAEMLREIDTLPTRATQVLSLPINPETLALLELLIARQQNGEVLIYTFEPGRPITAIE